MTWRSTYCRTDAQDHAGFQQAQHMGEVVGFADGSPGPVIGKIFDRTDGNQSKLFPTRSQFGQSRVKHAKLAVARVDENRPRIANRNFHRRFHMRNEVQVNRRRIIR